jgi:hypothetical protein
MLIIDYFYQLNYMIFPHLSISYPFDHPQPIRDRISLMFCIIHISNQYFSDYIV